MAAIVVRRRRATDWTPGPVGPRVIARRNDRWNVMVIEREPGQWYLGGTVARWPRSTVHRRTAGWSGSTPKRLNRWRPRPGCRAGPLRPGLGLVTVGRRLLDNGLRRHRVGPDDPHHVSERTVRPTAGSGSFVASTGPVDRGPAAAAMQPHRPRRRSVGRALRHPRWRHHRPSGPHPGARHDHRLGFDKRWPGRGRRRRRRSGGGLAAERRQTEHATVVFPIPASW